MANTILVVDDEPDVEMLITQQFRSMIRAGLLQFEFAANGQVALDLLHQNKNIDIVFTDINMPVMDGLTLMNRMKEANLTPKTIVISAYGDIANIRSAMNQGAFDFITKPIDLADLEVTMNKAINENEIFKQGIAAKINLDLTMREKEIAVMEKIAAQNEALENLKEKEKLILHQNEILELKVEERTYELMEEKKKADQLLLNILPAETAEELKATGTALAKHFDEVTVFFADFIGFAKISEKLSPTDLVHEINYCFSAFDKIVSKYGVEKIKTIGDAYMCAGGLPVANQTHAYDVLCAAIEIRDFMIKHKKDKDALGEFTFDLRIGIHTGPVVAGIVGIIKFAYDIWGNTVNMASRMESSSESGKINISAATYNKVNDKFVCEYRGLINAKNFGDVDMYFVTGEIKK